jgi:hypothetical protein
MINKTIILSLVFALTMSLSVIAKAGSGSPEGTCAADSGERSELLLHSAMNGDTHAVSELAECPDADLNVRDGGNRKTALMLAAQNGHARIVRVLIDNGADLNLRSSDRLEAIHYSYEFGHSNITRMLRSAGATGQLPDGRSAAR